MLRHADSRKEIFELAKELISSIKELNRRLSELIWVLGLANLDANSKKEIKNRVKQLVDTRFKLMFSFFDIKMKLIGSCYGGNFGDEEKKLKNIFEGITYKSLKCL